MLCFVVSVLPGSCTVAGILVILDSCSASLFLGSRFVVDMILYLVVVATFHQISDFFLGISFFFFVASSSHGCQTAKDSRGTVYQVLQG